MNYFSKLEIVERINCSMDAEVHPACVAVTFFQFLRVRTILASTEFARMLDKLIYLACRPLDFEISKRQIVKGR